MCRSTVRVGTRLVVVGLVGEVRTRVCPTLLETSVTTATHLCECGGSDSEELVLVHVGCRTGFVRSASICASLKTHQTGEQYHRTAVELFSVH